jgi:hypothetical protein
VHAAWRWSCRAAVEPPGKFSCARICKRDRRNRRTRPQDWVGRQLIPLRSRGRASQAPRIVMPKRACNVLVEVELRLGARSGALRKFPGGSPSTLQLEGPWNKPRLSPPCPSVWRGSVQEISWGLVSSHALMIQSTSTLQGRFSTTLRGSSGARMRASIVRYGLLDAKRCGQHQTIPAMPLADVSPRKLSWTLPLRATAIRLRAARAQVQPAIPRTSEKNPK